MVLHSRYEIISLHYHQTNATDKADFAEKDLVTELFYLFVNYC